MRLTQHRSYHAWVLCVITAGCGGSETAPATDVRPHLTTLDIFAGQPGGQGWVDGSLVAAHFQQPWAITGGGAGHLYVADGNLIRAIDQTHGAVSTLAGQFGHVGSSDGVGTA